MIKINVAVLNNVVTHPQIEVGQCCAAFTLLKHGATILDFEVGAGGVRLTESNISCHGQYQLGLGLIDNVIKCPILKKKRKFSVKLERVTGYKKKNVDTRQKKRKKSNHKKKETCIIVVMKS